MRRIFFAAVASILILDPAIAQQTAPMPGMDMKGMMDMKAMMPNTTDSAAAAGYKAAMMKMMMPMTPYTGTSISWHR